jgi:hypothetical protein
VVFLGTLSNAVFLLYKALNLIAQVLGAGARVQFAVFLFAGGKFAGARGIVILCCCLIVSTVALDFFFSSKMHRVKEKR